MRILKKTLWPNLIVIDNANSIDSIEIWLEQNLGSFKDKWNVVYCHNKTDFYFRDEEDAFVFKLRWL